MQESHYNMSHHHDNVSVNFWRIKIKRLFQRPDKQEGGGDMCHRAKGVGAPNK